MTISSYSIAKAILRTKITYIIVQLRYFGNNLSRRSNIVIVNNNNNIVIVKMTRPTFLGAVPSYFEALWYPHLYVNFIGSLTHRMDNI